MAINLDNILNNINGLCDADKLDYNSLLFEQYLQDSPFASEHVIQTDVRNNQIIPFLDAKPDYGYLKVSQGNCEMNVCDYNAESSIKRWNPKDYDCRMEICKDDLTCDFRKFWNMRCKDFDNEQDAFMVFLAEKINESVNSSQWRIAWFDDSENTDPAYAGIDGLWKQLLALAPEGNPNRHVIEENSAATIAAQMTLAPDAGYNAFSALYDWLITQNPTLFTSTGLVFESTPEIALNYLKWLQVNKEVECCFSSTDGVTGSRYSIPNLNYMGIPIVLRYEWSNIIKWLQQQSGAVNYDNPHRILLTYESNLPVGTCDDEAFRSFEMWYERYTKKIVIDVESSFDAKVLRDNDFAIAV